jgi:hypothetical protein
MEQIYDNRKDKIKLSFDFIKISVSDETSRNVKLKQKCSPDINIL